MSIDRFQNKKVLVTGGAGFIGSNLIETLLKLNNQVVCLDDFSTGKRKNIEPFLLHPNFTLVEASILNEQACIKAAQGNEVIFHQAALGSVPRSVHDPLTTHNVNLTGFVNILNAARANGIKRVVYASSSSVYGDHPALPKVEEQTGRLLSPYAVTKMGNELYASVFGPLYEMELMGLRYFNVFGKCQDPDSVYAAVLPKFVKALIEGQSPVINGDGTNSRDFTYIENVIQANILAALTENPEALNTVYNVAYGESTNLKELFQALVDNLKSFLPGVENIKPEFGPERPGDIKHSLASIDKARRLLGYAPEYDFSRGISLVTEWYYKDLKPA